MSGDRRPDAFGSHERALRAGHLLHVVNWHVTAPGARGRAELERVLTAHLAELDPVRPEHLDAWFATGTWPLPRPGFVPAFYDGYREHAEVAAPVCDALGITAWFLPPTGFLDTPPHRQRAFCAAHDIDLPDDPHPDGRLAMTWDELAAIAAQHVVVAHTATHARPEHVRDAASAERELVEPRRRLQEVSGQAVDVVVWRGGLPDDPADPAFRAVRAAGYRYLLSATKVQRLSR